MPVLVHFTSSEIMSCKECGQRFATAAALRKHKKLGKGEGSFCHEIDWTSKVRKTGKAKT
jgi:hypothetical protein